MERLFSEPCSQLGFFEVAEMWPHFHKCIYKMGGLIPGNLRVPRAGVGQAACQPVGTALLAPLLLFHGTQAGEGFVTHVSCYPAHHTWATSFQGIRIKCTYQ